MKEVISEKEELQSYQSEILNVIDNLYRGEALPEIGNDRQAKYNPLNDQFDSQSFQSLWNRISQQAVYRVEFDSNELISNCH